MSDITNEGLLELGFKPEKGTPANWLFYRSDRVNIETYPEFADREGKRRWWIGGQCVRPRPTTIEHVRQMLAMAKAEHR